MNRDQSVTVEFYKDKEFKNKTKKDRLWVEQAEGLNYDGERPFIYQFVFVVAVIFAYED